MKGIDLTHVSSTTLIRQVLQRMEEWPAGQTWHAGPWPGVTLAFGRSLGYAWQSITPTVTLAMVLRRGEAEWRTVSQRDVNEPGSIMVLDQATFHTGEGSRQSDYLMVFMDRALFDSLAGLRVSVLPAGQYRTMAGQRALAAAALATLDGDHDLARRSLKSVVEAVVSEASSIPVARSATPALQRVWTSLRRGYDEEWTVRELADEVGMPVESLIRSFRRQFGITPHQLRMQWRLHHAARGLFGHSTLTDIAMEHGFSDAAHFTNQFRRQFHVSPSVWRASLLGTARL